jgi:hypothetical protein
MPATFQRKRKEDIIEGLMIISMSIEDKVRKNIQEKGLAFIDKDDNVTISQKAIDLIDAEKKLPKGMKYRCFICHTIVDKKCARCSNYFCKEHRVFEYGDGTVLCKPCDDFIQEHF